jgi:O-antigen ligase
VLSNSNLLGQKTVNNICWSFVFGVLVILVGYTIITLDAIIRNRINYTEILSDRLSNISPIADQTIIDIHPSFLSMYLSFSTIFILVFLQSKPKKKEKVLSIIILLLICIFQIWLNSRAGLIGFVVVLIFFFFYHSKKQLQNLLLIIGFIVLLLSVPYTRERFIFAPLRALQIAGEVNAKDPNAWPISFRFQILDCSVSLLNNNRWIFGYGTGDFRDKINQCFIEKEYGWIVARDLDAHNEYFSQLHRHGIAGLALFICCLVVPLRLAFKRKITLYIAFLLLIIISAIPETLLSSQKGVVFYALFNSLLFHLCIREHYPSKIQKADDTPTH